MKNKIIHIGNINFIDEELKKWLEHLKLLTPEEKATQVDDLIDDIKELLNCEIMKTQLMPIFEQD